MMWTKRVMRDTRDIALTGLTIGFTSQVVGAVGGAGAADTQAGLSALARGTRYMGAISATGLVLDGFSQLAKKYPKY